MLSCKELAQKHASDYIDDNLTAREKLSVRLHLMMCSHCRRFIKKMRIAKALILHRKSVSISTMEENPDEARVQSIVQKLMAAKKHQ